ncbi:MAG: DNA polymerase III subunit gamma/tau [Candidatus Omnitrophota bacterium]
MSYLALARKYRPQEFDEIVGQAHIATTLKNAIAMDMVAHAYLFAGARGVGKTSTARILAKSLNCEKGPTPKPCGKCASCSEITRGVSMDVIEIDGASNRGIDEIRNLKENTKFASVRGKFRIYIIDEVHMLTPEAFNALLKTLEEPPLHVKFIFATTRPYKMPATIISRCQRFDFRKISTEDIVKKLGQIKAKEKFTLEGDAMFLIARAADGSLRDAEIILDQLLSFTKGKIRSDDVVEVLGLLERGILFELADCIINNEKERILKIIDELINSGKDSVYAASCIIEHFRNIMAAKITKDKGRALVAASEEDYHKLKEQGLRLSLDDILYITYTLSAAIDLMKKTLLSRIPLEITLIKLTEKKRLTSIKEILDRLSRVEKALANKTFEAPVASPVIARTTKSSEAISRMDSQQASPRSFGAHNDKITGSAVPKEEVAAEKDILLLQKVKDSWAKILNFVKTRKMSVGTFLAEGVLLKVKDNILAVGFGRHNSLHKEALEANTNTKFVEEAIKSITGEDIRLSFESVEIEAEREPAPVGVEEGGAEGIPAEKSNKIEPIVESAVDIFDGRIVDIRKGSVKGK